MFGTKFYRMADDCFIAVAGRSTSPAGIKQLQQKEWTRKHGGICEIVEYTEPRAIYFAQKSVKNNHR